MSGPAGDRVTIDLRGIGDSIRAAASGRGLTIAAFAREALVNALSVAPAARQLPDAPSARLHGTVKLTWRMDVRAAELLAANARALGLSYGQYVGYLVSAAPLPAPLDQRAADRAALQASTDQVAVLAREVSEVLRLARAGRSVEEAGKRAEHIRSLVVDVRRHLDLASSFLSDRGGTP
ncbi:MAG TPA: hypothetical protein VFU71_05420 [Burkholderiaceae bacterium]|nr:hypothetical protein [Burkholderiaceae bacterium]